MTKLDYDFLPANQDVFCAAASRAELVRAAMTSSASSPTSTGLLKSTTSASQLEALGPVADFSEDLLDRIVVWIRHSGFSLSLSVSARRQAFRLAPSRRSWRVALEACGARTPAGSA